MSSTALAHDSLLPRPPGGMGAGATLALLAHAGLVAALAVGVEWRVQPPPTVAAELWASVPQLAAPPAPAPAPPPPPAPAPPPPAPAPAPKPAPPPPPARAPERVPDAQIALERQRAERAAAQERERAQRAAAEKAAAQKAAEAKAAAEKAAQAKAAADKAAADKAAAEKAAAEKVAAEKAAAEKAAAERRRAEDEARLAQQRAENLRRMLAQAETAGAATGTGTARGATAAREAGPSAAYGARLATRIRANIIKLSGAVAGNPAAEVEVRVQPDGRISARRILKSSGLPEWDETVLRAIDRTERLPADTDGRVPPVIVVTFRPND